MQPQSFEQKLKLGIACVSVFLIVIAVYILWSNGKLITYINILSNLFSTKDQLREYIQNQGNWAPFVFIGIQVIQVLFAPIPGEAIGFVGGFVFGAFWNIIFSTIGLTLGSSLAFLCSRIIGRPFVDLFLQQATIQKFEFLMRQKGSIGSFILFMIPGFPKDIFCYLLGLSPMKFTTFLFVCGIGRIPGTILLSVSGSALYVENWPLLSVIALFSAIIIGIVLFKRDAIYSWLDRLFHQ